MLSRFKAPGACESAAAPFGLFGVHTHLLLQHLHLRIDAARRLMMAVPPNDHLSVELGDRYVVLLEELCPMERVLMQPHRVLVIRKNLNEFVTEHSKATWLHTD